MEPSFNEFSKVVTKYVLGSQERFNELKERMEMCEYATSKAGAAALGYLIAMEEKEQENRNIYDIVFEQVENDGEDSCLRTEAIFLAMYKWLDPIFEQQGFYEGSDARELLTDAFTPHTIL
jgi:hypothetical protein